MICCANIIKNFNKILSTTMNQFSVFSYSKKGLLKSVALSSSMYSTLGIFLGLAFVTNNAFSSEQDIARMIMEEIIKTSSSGSSMAPHAAQYQDGPNQNLAQNLGQGTLSQENLGKGYFIQVGNKRFEASSLIDAAKNLAQTEGNLRAEEALQVILAKIAKESQQHQEKDKQEKEKENSLTISLADDRISNPPLVSLQSPSASRGTQSERTGFSTGLSSRVSDSSSERPIYTGIKVPAPSKNVSAVLGHMENMPDTNSATGDEQNPTLGESSYSGEQTAGDDGIRRRFVQGSSQADGNNAQPIRRSFNTGYAANQQGAQQNQNTGYAARPYAAAPSYAVNNHYQNQQNASSPTNAYNAAGSFNSGAFNFRPHETVPQQMHAHETFPPQMTPHEILPQQMNPHENIPPHILQQQIMANEALPPQMIPHEALPPHIIAGLANGSILPHQIMASEHLPPHIIAGLANGSILPQNLSPEQAIALAQLHAQMQTPPQREGMTQQMHERQNPCLRLAKFFKDTATGLQTNLGYAYQKSWKLGSKMVVGGAAKLHGLTNGRIYSYQLPTARVLEKICESKVFGGEYQEALEILSLPESSRPSQDFCNYLFGEACTKEKNDVIDWMLSLPAGSRPDNSGITFAVIVARDNNNKALQEKLLSLLSDKGPDEQIIYGSFINAATKGNKEKMAWLKSMLKDRDFNPDVLNAAFIESAGAGSKNCCDYLLQQMPAEELNQETLDNAFIRSAGSGALSVANWLFTGFDKKVSEKGREQAFISGGHNRAVLEWLLILTNETVNQNYLGLALIRSAEIGSQENINWIMDFPQNKRPSQFHINVAFTKACQNNHQSVVLDFTKMPEDKRPTQDALDMGFVFSMNKFNYPMLNTLLTLPEGCRPSKDLIKDTYNKSKKAGIFYIRAQRFLQPYA